jgi:hypothetical protein
MSRKQAGRRLGAGLLLLMALLLAVGLLKLLSASSEGSRPPEVGRGKGSVVSSQDSSDPAASPASFGIFRTPPEALPLSVKRVIGNDRYGIRSRLAQRLPIKFPASVWAVPAQRMLCLLSRRQSGAISLTCDQVEDVAADGLSVTFLNPPTQAPVWRRTIVGIAPDGMNHTTAVSTADRSRIEVSRNVFIWRDNVPEAPLRLEGEHGNQPSARSQHLANAN